MLLVHIGPWHKFPTFNPEFTNLPHGFQFRHQKQILLPCVRGAGGGAGEGGPEPEGDGGVCDEGVVMSNRCRISAAVVFFLPVDQRLREPLSGEGHGWFWGRSNYLFETFPGKNGSDGCGRQYIRGRSPPFFRTFPKNTRDLHRLPHSLLQQSINLQAKARITAEIPYICLN